MKRIAASLGIACALALGGCSMALPVEGTFEAKADPFTGEATGYQDGFGFLDITFASGRTCSGTFTHVSPIVGQGALMCSDGAVGVYTFVYSGRSATGSGTLDGYRFRFTFGLSPVRPERPLP